MTTADALAKIRRVLDDVEHLLREHVVPYARGRLECLQRITRIETEMRQVREALALRGEGRRRWRALVARAGVGVAGGALTFLVIEVVKRFLASARA